MLRLAWGHGRPSTADKTWVDLSHFEFAKADWTTLHPLWGANGVHNRNPSPQS